MNSRTSLYDVKSFYNKNAVLCASFQGMRYQVERFGKEGDAAVLRAVVWPEPFCFEKTPEEYKTYEEFSYDEEGLDNVYQWLCSCYQERMEEWELAKSRPLEQAAKMGCI